MDLSRRAIASVNTTVILVASGVGLGLALGGIAYAHPSWAWLAATAAVLIAAGVFLRVLEWRVGLVVLLIVTSLVDRLSLIHI